MQIRILGSAAGGGLPQWNCQCSNCRAARRSNTFRSQSSAAVSDDGKTWLLLNASPDVAYQFASFPPLATRGQTLRGTSVAAVILTDAEMDHTAGLLSLRENKSLRLVCTDAVKRLLTKSFPLLPTLEKYCQVRHSSFPVQIAGIRISALELETEKAPPYSRHNPRHGAVVGLRLQSVKTKRSCVYVPGLPAITEILEQWVAECDCLIVDGTFWSEREMISLGLSRRTARQMGHVAISGKGGSLEWLRGLDVPRKILTHINNSNPILNKTSQERRMVERAGVEISHDGMHIRI
ncbi:MAG TPA: pyrroloquinoline quinone biosynthesis protein PqqB [Verrucomicrobiae bacterium]|nr:pyrroloquinoline quinone biosynthesis protein PqqB [Verrucomicrobiae bacterium]